MAGTTVYFVVVGIGVILILSLIAYHRNLVDESSLLATPTIPKKNALLTCLGSTIIQAKPEEVFKILLDYKGYSKWASMSEHQWETVDADEVPLVGSKCSFKVNPPIFIFSQNL